MTTRRAQDLLFLFGLTAVATAGCDADDGDSAATATASSTGTDGSTSTGTAEVSGSTAADPTAPPTSGDAGDVCAAIAEKSGECDCDTDYNTALGYCADTFAYLDATYGADCVAAYEDVLACVLTLDCKSFNAEPRTGCPVEQQAFEDACGGAGGSSGGEGGTTTDGSTSGG